MATTSKAELARLGGLENCVRLLDNKATDVSVRESAALAVANCTQHQDSVCTALVGLGDGLLERFLSHLSSPNTLIKRCVARAIANTSAIEGPEDVAQVLCTAGAVPLLLDNASSDDLPLLKGVTSALDNMAMDNAAVRVGLVDAGAADVLVPCITHDDPAVAEAGCSVLCSLSEASAKVASMLADNGGFRRLLQRVHRLAERISGAEGKGKAVTPDSVEELVVTILTNALSMLPESALTLAEYDPGFASLTQLLNVRSAQVQTDTLRCLTAMTTFALTAGNAPGARGGALRKIRQWVTSAKPILGALLLLDHEDEEVDEAAEALVDALRRGSPGSSHASRGAPRAASEAAAGAGAGAGSGSAVARAAGSGVRRAGSSGGVDTLKALVEAGAVPELYRLQGSVRERTVAYTSKVLAALSEQVQGDTLAGLLETVAIDSDLNKRVTVAHGLVYLCFWSDSIKAAFLTDRGLGCVLGLLRYNTKRSGALDFLARVLPILRPVEDAAPVTALQDAVEWSASHVNNEKHTDLTLIVSPKKTMFHAHKTVLKCHSGVVAAMPSNRKEIIELHEFPLPVVSSSMKALYTNDYSRILTRADSPEFMVQVLSLCNKLELTRFQAYVSAVVQEHFINPDSIVDVLKAALECGDLGLCSACIDYVIANHELIAVATPHHMEHIAQQLQILLTRTLQAASAS